MSEQFQGIEEYLKSPNFTELFNEALEEAKYERNTRIKSSIKGLLAELKEIDGQIKALNKKRSKIEGRLKGYSSNRVPDVKDESDTETPS